MACVGWIKQSESTRCDPARERYPAPGQARGDHAESTRCDPSRTRPHRTIVYANNIYNSLYSSSNKRHELKAR